METMSSQVGRGLERPRDDEVLIETKLFVPVPRQQPVVRRRLENRLDACVGVPLTVVVAPAGWGKTSLVAGWVRQDRVAAGWVSLDRGDDDARRFWRYLLRALADAGRGVGVHALHRLEAAGSNLERDVVPVLLNELADAPDDVLVVLDDYHAVSSREVHTSMATLLDRAPPHLHLVVSARSDPPLGVSRRRVTGQLLEIRADQLQFTVDEAAQLLARVAGAPLDTGDVQRLVARTEGWAAGLQLAALRLADRPDGGARTEFIDRFTGADRHVLDYLGEEVLAEQPADVRGFLFATSILHRMCGPLADAVTGRMDGAQMLDDICRANLFVTALDGNQRWYRYHHLFRDILRHELDRTDGTRVPALHRRAAAWYAEAGDLRDAIGHAQQSGDTGMVAELVGAAWRNEFNAGNLQTVRSWLDALDALDENAIAADARLGVARVWLALDAGQLDDADAALSAAERGTPGDAHLHVLRALLTYKTGNVSRALEVLESVGVPTADPFTATVRHLLTGTCALWSDDTSRAAGALRAATESASTEHNRLARVYALGCRAVLAAERADPVDAEDLLRRADADVADVVSDTHFVAMFPALGRARLALATGDRAAAASAAAHAIELARRGAGRVELAAALITMARAARSAPTADGLVDGRYLDEAAQLLRSCADPGSLVRRWVAAEWRAVHADAPDDAKLTGRELAVLELLPGPLSQREMADALFVTPNTVKTHLRAIYRKLGAESRAQAVSRARAGGLL